MDTRAAHSTSVSAALCLTSSTVTSLRKLGLLSAAGASLTVRGVLPITGSGGAHFTADMRVAVSGGYAQVYESGVDITRRTSAKFGETGTS
ncbi:hypothetical protein GCM10010358_64790 [Streptomyces minutiscleroticus]|uniref:Uncharacterized protein n=1 Tax=Streptomyces minutiscleroticus TaxID=68238 RepID=A0A918U6V6_9ACTN|nr:hypothetical protein GCM10010358_64790 [Streptomyces minutiscleroticus]